MPYIPQSKENTGLYIPTTTVYEIGQDIAAIQDLSPETKQVLIKLYQSVNSISLSLNAKTSGLYDVQEFVSGKQYFNPNPDTMNQPRSGFSRTYNLGAIGAGANTFAHGLAITSAWTFVNIYGVANDTVGFNYYQLGWPSAGGATNIELKVNNTNIVITNNSGINFDQTIVTLEYLKN